MFETFGHHFPAVLDQLARIACIYAQVQQLLVAKYCTSLQHATQDCLLSHQIGLHFSNKGGFQYTGSVTASGRRIGFGDGQAIALGIVFWVHSD